MKSFIFGFFAMVFLLGSTVTSWGHERHPYRHRCHVHHDCEAALGTDDVPVEGAIKPRK